MAILIFFSITRNSSGWPSSKVDMLMLYISDVVVYGFFRILALMVLLARSSFSSNLMRVIGGGLIRDFTFAHYGEYSWSDVLVLINLM